MTLGPLAGALWFEENLRSGILRLAQQRPLPRCGLRRISAQVYSVKCRADNEERCGLRRISAQVYLSGKFVFRLPGCGLRRISAQVYYKKRVSSYDISCGLRRISAQVYSRRARAPRFRGCGLRRISAQVYYKTRSPLAGSQLWFEENLRSGILLTCPLLVKMLLWFEENLRSGILRGAV